MRVPLLLGFLLLAPVAGAQGIGSVSPESTQTTLYFHLLGPGDMPINTQQPPADYETEFAAGPAATTPCVPETPPVYAAQDFATWYGYASPSPVDYLADGSIRVHPERGIAYEVQLDGAANFTVFWYLLVETPINSGETLPMPSPNLQILATMRASDALSIDDLAYNAGALLAHGQTEPASVLGDQVLGGGGHVRPVRQVGQAWVYEFAVPMQFDDTVIPRATGFNIRIDVRIDNPGCQGAAPPLTVHSSAPARPRLAFNVLNPLRIEYFHPQFVDDGLVLHTSVNSAWGPYDVDDANSTLEVKGPGMAEFVRLANTNRDGQRYNHMPGTDFSWLWENATSGPPGRYDLRMNVTNLDRSATASATASFEIAPRNDAPFPPPIFLLLALLTVLLVRRRR